MLREHRELVRKIHLALDLLCIGFAWGFCYVFLAWCGYPLAKPNVYLPQFVIFTFVSIFYLSAGRFRPEEHLVNPVGMFREICAAVLLGALSLGFSFYLFKLEYLSRPFLLTGCGLSLFCLLAWNMLINRFYRQIRLKGLNYQRLLLVGNGYTLPRVIRAIQQNPSLGQRIEAVILTGDGREMGEVAGFNVYRDIRKISEILDLHVIDNALFTIYRQEPIEIEKAMLKCQERGINVWLKPDFMHGALISRVDYLADIPLFVFSLGPRFGLGFALKRLFDVIVAAILLVLLAVPMAVVALLVKTTPGPVLFRQKRVGLNGRRFVMSKFRTMCEDAEQRKAEYNLKNEMYGPVFKMKDDPRITPIGRFLRKYSLDELPQIWSVLIGDMSLVGPRPPIPTEVDLYEGWQRRRLSMRPGITCIWQVTGRNKITDFNEWAKLDLEYIDKWSPLLDLTILLKTVPVVFKGTGI